MMILSPYIVRVLVLNNRKLKKRVAKTSWYDDEMVSSKVSWRSKLPREWSGDKPDQVKIHGM